MKTHLKLTVVLFVAIAALFLLVSRNHKLISKSNSFSILTNSSSIILKNGKNVDSTEFKKLIPFFTTKKDEFDASGTLIYLPKGFPEKPKDNAIYCYFEQMNDSVRNLRFRMQVGNKEWLFYKKCQFLIDGKIYDYSPQNVEFGEGRPGFVCEWFDNVVNEENYSIIKALSIAKAAKVKIIGRNYDKIIVFSDDQLSSIDRTLDLYASMNGGIDY